MSEYITHLLLAESINKEYLHYKKEKLAEFLWGNLAPDINAGYDFLPERRLQDNQTHFIHKETLSTNEYSYIAFCNRYWDQLTEPFVLGYLYHIFIDQMVRQYFYQKINPFDLAGRNDSRMFQKKAEDIHLWTSKRNIRVMLPTYIDSIESKSKLVKDICLTANDYKNFFEYLRNYHLPKPKDQYNVFTDEELTSIFMFCQQKFMEFVIKKDLVRK